MKSANGDDETMGCCDDQKAPIGCQGPKSQSCDQRDIAMVVSMRTSHKVKLQHHCNFKQPFNRTVIKPLTLSRFYL